MAFNRELVQEFIKSNMRPGNLCPVCSSSDWALFDEVFELRSFSGGNLVLGPGSKVIPAVILMCNVCGHMMLFNAIAVKAVERNEQPIKETKAG